MTFPMARYFAKLPPDQPIQRGSWSFELDRPPYLDGAMGPAEAEARVHPRVGWRALRRLPSAAR
jgi:hypothetical protein